MPHAVVSDTCIVTAAVSDCILTLLSAYETLVKEGFARAFENARYAAAELHAIDMDSDISDVAYWLFGPSEEWGEAESRLKNVSNIPSEFTTSMLYPRRLEVTCPLAKLD